MEPGGLAALAPEGLSVGWGWAYDRKQAPGGLWGQARLAVRAGPVSPGMGVSGLSAPPHQAPAPVLSPRPGPPLLLTLPESAERELEARGSGPSPHTCMVA